MSMSMKMKTQTISPKNHQAISSRLFLKGIRLPEAKEPETPADDDGEEEDDDDDDDELLMTRRRRRRQELFQQDVRNLFEPFGHVQEVFLPCRGRTTKRHYRNAFVTMATLEQAQQALESISTITPHALFDEIRPASALMVADLAATSDDSMHDGASTSDPAVKQVMVVPSQKKKKKKKMKRQQQQHEMQLQKLRTLAESANLVLQCYKSHAERLVDYLEEASAAVVQRRNHHHRHRPNALEEKVTVLGASSHQIVSLIFCHCPSSSSSSSSSPAAVARWLDSIWYIRGSIQRSFVLATFTSSTSSKKFPIVLQTCQLPDASTWIKMLRDPTPPPPLPTEQNNDLMMNIMKVRLNTYPPKLLPEILSALEVYYSTQESSSTDKDRVITFTPSHQAATHVWSVLQLVPPNPALEQEGLYMMGLCECEANPVVVDEENIPSTITQDDELLQAVRIEQQQQPQQQQEDRSQRPAIMSSFGATTGTTTNGLSESCCRAYWKLQEALERYQEVTGHVPLPLMTSSHSNPLPINSSSAIDVGASPGGWTQFLIQQCQCRTVYSIDPGILDPRVLALNDDKDSEDSSNNNPATAPRSPRVRHIPLTFQNGLPEIVKQRQQEEIFQQPPQAADGRDHDDRSSPTTSLLAVDWYVSDMCVKNLGGQVDALLMAVQLGLVAPHKTFCILTLKCTRGHSKATFDSLVDEQVRRLCSTAATTTTGSSSSIIPKQHPPQEDVRKGNNNNSNNNVVDSSFQVLHLFANRQSERTVMGLWT